MSEKVKKVNKGGEEEYKVLDEVYDANWRDDVSETGVEDAKVKTDLGLEDFQYYSDEEKYNSQDNELTPSAMEKIRIFRLEHEPIMGNKVISLARKAA